MEDNKNSFFCSTNMSDDPYNYLKVLDKSIILYLLMVVGIPTADAATT